MKRSGVCTSFTILILFLSLFSMLDCSEDIGSYRELDESGKVNDTVRKRYASFFKGIESLTQAAAGNSSSIDSTIIIRAASETDGVVADMLTFPSTLNARIAFDAVSFAAADIVTLPENRHPDVRNFWQQGLLAPLFSTGKLFVDEGDANESAHVQILKGLQRAMGGMANEDMLYDCMSIVGITPSRAAMAFCDADTFVFKKIHDLIIYSRSMQETDPPLWLLSGNWLFALQFEGGQPPIFLVVSPHIVDDLAYLAFRDYSIGDIYASAFDDPIPTDLETWDTWYIRANAVMKSLTIDDDFAERVRTSGLSARESHYFYDDYLIRTDADSVKREIAISFIRRQVQQGNFEYVGRDSIAVTFDENQILSAYGPVTEVHATREIGASLVGGQLYPKENNPGTAYIMALGEHNIDIVEAYRQQLRQMIGPKITVSTEPATGPTNTQRE